nr:ATP-binding protein [uncultured Caldimonas sp.]
MPLSPRLTDSVLHDALAELARETRPEGVCSVLLARVADLAAASSLQLFLLQGDEWIEAARAERSAEQVHVHCLASLAAWPAPMFDASGARVPKGPLVECALAVVRDGDAVLGVLTGELERALDQEAAQALSFITRHAAIGLARTTAHARLQDENERLRRTSETLSIQGDLLRTFGENMPHRIYAKDREHRFIFGNTAVAVGMGAERPEQLLGRTDFDFYPEDDARQYTQEEQTVMASGEPMIDREEDVSYLLTGRRAWMLTTKVPLRDRHGEVIGIAGINYDITDRKQMELELQRRNAELADLNQRLSQAQAQLLQSEKLASIGQLAAGVAHEINNPVGYVASNVHTLGEYVCALLALLGSYERLALPELPEQARRELDALCSRVDVEYLKTDAPALIDETEEGLGRVRKIVQDLKDFSRVDDRLEWQWTDLHRCLDVTLNITKSATRYSVDVVKEYGDLPAVQCLPSQINQVLMNLLINAVHAVEAAGNGRGCVTIRTGADDGNAWIEMVDTGCGIPPEHLSRIFDPFFTTKPVGQGTGLGLSLAYGIVQKHGGRIDVQSKVGEGSSFRVTLPVRQAASCADAA